jgi:NAD(P)H-quinone oxidoreductase subunit 5
MTAGSTVLLWLAPALWILGSLAARLNPEKDWLAAEAAAGAAALVAVAGAIEALRETLAGGAADLLGVVMVALIAFLGWVVLRFSRDYLYGEPGQNRYVVALTFTVAAVLTVVLTNYLGVLILAWASSSVGLYYLLTFFHERWPAQIVAHKKFLASRMSELFLIAGAVLLYMESGTLTLDGIAAFAAQQGELPATMRLAAVLLAMGVVFKTAQLPLHGWLIQVMEAPTPVSALLHAGIVNIGGFVIIRMAPLFSAAPEAQALLVVVGSITALMAGMVMMTRISIKVRLAWSTCAQMGFMLMECGLGLYELALLHLVAHSLYKAHEFLTAGDTVLAARQRDLTPEASRRMAQTRVGRRVLALPAALLIVGGSLAIWQALIADFAVAGVAIFVVALGLAPLLWGATDRGGQPLLRGFLRVTALAQLYFLWHWCFATLAPPAAEPALALSVWVVGCFAALYVLQVWILAYPRGALSQTLYPWAYAGFYLDERFTRLTFKLWPARIGAEHSNRVMTSTRDFSG